MRTRLTLRPGQKGTRGLCDQYSERLVCVRYRHDESRKLRFKTVELIVGERPWVYCRPWRETPFHRKVPVATQYGERDLGRALNGDGGAWRPEHQAWEAEYQVAERLGVQGLIVVERAPGPQGKGPWRPKSTEHLTIDAGRVR